MSKPEEMWQCQMSNCGYIYDPARGDKKGKIPPNTKFADLPEDWHCPCCGAGKMMFRPLAGPGSTAPLPDKCATDLPGVKSPVSGGLADAVPTKKGETLGPG